MEDNERYIPLLKKAVEEKLGRGLSTPRDYDNLQEKIMAATGMHVSSTTLKRMMGYINDGKKPRTYSLDLVCKYVGSDSWMSFVEQHADNKEVALFAPIATEEKPKRKSYVWVRWIVAGCVVLTLAFAIFQLKVKVDRLSTQNTQLTEQLSRLRAHRVLVAGKDTFKTYQDYLRLFNIVDSQNVALTRNINSLNTIFKQKKEEDIWWYKELKGLPNVYLWGPEYHHPIWHNDGDSTLLLPTINEYLDSKKVKNDIEKSVVDMSDDPNQPFYKQELRITFMSNIGGDGYIFLGVYAAQKQDRHHSTWRRVSTKLDLDNLSDLESLRRKVYKTGK